MQSHAVIEENKTPVEEMFYSLNPINKLYQWHSISKKHLVSHTLPEACLLQPHALMISFLRLMRFA